MGEYIVVLVTASDEEEGEKIGRTLVEERLAACVNLLRGVRSFYRWEGKICDDSEVLLVIKTTRSLYEALEQRVKSLHSYSVPEVIAWNLDAGSPQYLEWIEAATG